MVYESQIGTYVPIENGLNPCFCGRWFMSEAFRQAEIEVENVLILVFVEDGL